MNRFQFVADHSERFGVKRLCRVVGIARSSFYHWKATASARAARAAADARLAVRIRAVHTASDGTYGVPRITAELRDPRGRHGGEPVNHKRVARIMAEIGLAGLRLRRCRRTTIPDPNGVKAPDLIGRDFTAPAPNQRYVGDITYLPVGERGFLYLATVIDLHSRRLAGWAIANHMSHRPRPRRPARRAAHPRQPGRGDSAHRPRRAVRVEGLRRRLRCHRSPAVDVRGRQLRRQRPGRIVQRHLQTRNPARPTRVHRRTRSTPDLVPMAAPLQHRPPALPARTPIPEQLREQPPNNASYAGASRITPVSKIRG